jgi:hypothetical protein
VDTDGIEDGGTRRKQCQPLYSDLGALYDHASLTHSS